MEILTCCNAAYQIILNDQRTRTSMSEPIILPTGPSTDVVPERCFVPVSSSRYPPSDAGLLVGWSHKAAEPGDTSILRVPAASCVHWLQYHINIYHLNGGHMTVFGATEQHSSHVFHGVTGQHRCTVAPVNVISA